MKFLVNVVIFLSFSLLLACESNKMEMKDSSTSLTGQWQVDKVMHGWTGKIVKAETLPYQEYCQFNADSSFRKFTSEGVETKGTYSVTQTKAGDYEVALSFVETTDPGKLALQFSCGGKLILQLNKSEGLTESNLPCDGPKKYYKKLKGHE